MDDLSNTARYTIVRKIAEGGMGTVYEAIQHGDEGFSKHVAIKTLLEKFSQSKKLTEMFIAEAKLVADLVHENIVQILQLARNEQGLYIVMELVHGMSLHELLVLHTERQSRLPVELAVFIASRIARGLGYAHSRQYRDGKPMHIVHRDVTPKNILISTEGLPKLADFGLALITADLDPGTRLPLVGKPQYLSPEQALRQKIDFRTDIFGIGAVLFEMLAGREIRLAGILQDDLKLAEQGFIDWDKLPNTVPPDVFQILLSCLAADPAQRYATTTKLAYDLEYAIYRHGYGPTIQSLETYLRKHAPELYSSAV